MNNSLLGKRPHQIIVKYSVPADGIPPLLLGAMVRVAAMERGQGPWWLESGECMGPWASSQQDRIMNARCSSPG